MTGPVDDCELAQIAQLAEDFPEWLVTRNGDEYRAEGEDGTVLAGHSILLLRVALHNHMYETALAEVLQHGEGGQR